MCIYVYTHITLSIHIWFAFFVLAFCVLRTAETCLRLVVMNMCYGNMS